EVVLGKRVNERGEADLVFEQRGDVIKKNAALGKVRNFTDQLFKMFAVMRHLPCSFNAESIQSGHRLGWKFFYFIHSRGARAFLQPGAQCVKLLLCANGQAFHAAIQVVAHPTGQSQLARLVIHKPAEADSRDTATNNVSLSDHVPSSVFLFAATY